MHTEDGGDSSKPTPKTVSLKKFIPVCVDKSKGQYMFMLVPNESADNGAIEVYLSAETQNYEAPIKSVVLIGDNNVKVKGNVISEIEFVKDQTIRLKVELEYYEMCAMEVKAYATSK